MKASLLCVLLGLTLACARGEGAAKESLVIHADSPPADSAAVAALAMQAYREAWQRAGDPSPGKAQILRYQVFPDSTVVLVGAAVESLVNANGTGGVVLTSDGEVSVVVRGSTAAATSLRY